MENTTACTGDKGGRWETVFTKLDETGFYCTAYDPNDKGSNPQFTTIFFPNRNIPKEDEARQEFETRIQVEAVKIEGNIYPLPNHSAKSYYTTSMLLYKFVFFFFC